jgi:hypothetical protein
VFCAIQYNEQQQVPPEFHGKAIVAGTGMHMMPTAGMCSADEVSAAGEAYAGEAYAGHCGTLLFANNCSLLQTAIIAVPGFIRIHCAHQAHHSDIG